MIFASLGLDWSNFQRGMAGAMSSVRQLAGGASLFAGVAVAAKQMMDAINMGDELVDLNAQTGVAIDKLMELQMAFDLNGMKAEQVQPVLAKMQRLIAEAGSGSADAAAKFTLMGIAVADIQGLNADEQLMKIGEAITKIENPAQRSAVAMDIFGKSGAKLLSVFSAGGMEEVRKVLGNQSALLLENAGVFGKASDILGLTGSKVRGFFVGISAEIVPQLMGVLEAAEKLDFTNLGKSFGDGIAITLELIDRTFGKIMAMGEKAAKTQSTYGGQAFMGMGGMAGPGTALSAATEAAKQEQPRTSFFAEILKDIEAKREEARKKYATPGAAPTGMDIIRKAGTSGPLGMSDISSLQRVGGGSALLSGMQDNSPAYQSVRIQEDIRDFIKDLINVVKENGQDYQVTPSGGNGLVLTA